MSSRQLEKMSVLPIFLIVFLSSRCVGKAITKQDMDLFLVQVGTQSGNIDQAKPMQQLQSLAENKELDSSSMWQLVGVVCELSQSDGDRGPITFHEPVNIEKGCEFFERIAAHMLNHLGNELQIHNGEIQVPSSDLQHSIQGSVLRYEDTKGMFPKVCQKIHTGRDIVPVFDQPLDKSYIKEACDYLESASVDFLLGFDDHYEGHGLHELLGPDAPIKTSRNLPVTYDQVSMMLPSVCQKKLAGEYYRRNDIPKSCQVLETQTGHVLSSVSRIVHMSAPKKMQNGIETYRAKHQFKFHQAKPFIPAVCISGGMNLYLGYVIDLGVPWTYLACNYFLYDHMEALLKPDSSAQRS